MREARIDQFGGPEELYVADDAAIPEPAAGELLVRVRAAGTNPIDYKIRDGSSKWIQSLGDDIFPLVLGREASGTVAQVGAGVTGFEVGQEVFGMAPLSHPGRCYAEHVTVPADAMAHAPQGSDPLVLAGLGLVGNTAWQAAHDLGKVQAGETVLVQGGAGGVGQLLVQLCVLAGAEVWATASTKNQERLAELGAHPIDYTTQDFREVAPKVDLVLDGVYFKTFEPSLDQLKPGGRIVVMPSLADTTPAEQRGIECHVPAAAPLPERLEQLAADIVAGRMSLEVSRVLPLEQVAEAHRELEAGHSRGKIVLDLEA